MNDKNAIKTEKPDKKVGENNKKEEKDEGLEKWTSGEGEGEEEWKVIENKKDSVIIKNAKTEKVIMATKLDGNWQIIDGKKEMITHIGDKPMIRVLERYVETGDLPKAKKPPKKDVIPKEDRELIMAKMGFTEIKSKPDLWMKKILLDEHQKEPTVLWVDFRKSEKGQYWTSNPKLESLRLKTLGEVKALKLIRNGIIDPSKWDTNKPLETTNPEGGKEFVELSWTPEEMKKKEDEKKMVEENRERKKKEVEPNDIGKEMIPTEKIEKEEPKGAVVEVVPQMEIPVERAKQQLEQLQDFVRSVMVKNQDYGKIPGVNKPSLFKSGAEKLLNVMGMSAEFELMDKIEDWDNGFFHYRYKCIVRSKKYGHKVAECEGSCNSKEDKYRWRWIPEWKLPEGTNTSKLEYKTREYKSGSRKGEKYKLYRMENDDPYTLVNTLQKMSQKRSLVGATLIATRTSMTFTQDVEDMGYG